MISGELFLTIHWVKANAHFYHREAGNDHVVHIDVNPPRYEGQLSDHSTDINFKLYGKGGNPRIVSYGICVQI